MKAILSIFIFSSLSASTYLTSECDSPAIVDGVVNVYNGKLLQIDRDIEIQGADSLDLTRFYDGGHHFSSEYG